MAYRVVAAPVAVLTAQLRAAIGCLGVVTLEPAQIILDDYLVIPSPVAIMLLVRRYRYGGEQHRSKGVETHLVGSSQSSQRVEVARRRSSKHERNSSQRQHQR